MYSKKKSWFYFSLTGWLYGLYIEFIYSLFATYNPGAFLFCIFFYFLYLQMFYAIHLSVNKRIANPLTGHLLYFVLAAYIGLIILEWGFLGNSPWKNPDTSQLGMLLFHVAYPFLARIFSENTGDIQKLKRTIIIFSVLIMPATFFGIMIPHPFHRFIWFLYFPLLIYFLFWLFFIKFFLIIRRRIQVEKNEVIGTGDVMKEAESSSDDVF